MRPASSVVAFVVTFVVTFVVAYGAAFKSTSQIVQGVQAFEPFTSSTSIIKRFKSQPYITQPLMLKMRYQQDGVVFMDYVTKDNFIMVIIRGGKPVVRFSHDGDLHVVTLTTTPTIVLSVMKDPTDDSKVQVQGYNYVTKTVETKTVTAPFKRLTSYQMRLGDSAPASIRYGELSKGFTGDLYWIRYVDNYAASELR
jgi:hypothetical protein